MISINLLQHDVRPVVTRMPVAEFGGGRLGVVEGHLYEIVVSDDVTLVLDEQQVLDLTDKLLDAIPPQFQAGDDDEGRPGA